MQSTVSVSPITGKKYPITSSSCDRQNIDAFLEKNQGKPIVVVQGLGFVGAVMSLVCADALHGDYAVIGVDLPNVATFWKINSFNEGVFPLVAEDPKIDETYRRVREKESFYATYDDYAYSVADVIVVDINLDVQKKPGPGLELNGFDVDLSGFRRAMETVGRQCKPDVLVLVETTVPPGTCEKIVYPILIQELEKRGLPTSGLKVGHSYERVMPGPGYVDSIQNFYRVYSGINVESADAAESFLRTIISTKEYPLTRLGSTSATEIAKVLENSYRAMNISFIVEWSRFAEEAGVDLYEIVRAIRMRPTHSNMMLPGLGVGGYCLTKDPLLASWARENMFAGVESLGMSVNSVSVNDQMPARAFEFFRREVPESLEGKRVLFLGVSYRSEVGDTRFSPVAPLYAAFRRAGANVYWHDPYVQFWEEIREKVSGGLTELLQSEFDAIIVTCGHKSYVEEKVIQEILGRKPTILVDMLGHWSNEQVSRLKQKHVVKVLGRGDL